MDNFYVSDAVLRKLLDKHGVELAEVRQCFSNREGRLLQDNRALTKTDPPTLWFLALTNKNRLLKIVYIQVGSQVCVKSAFPPNEVERGIYTRHG